VTLGLSKYPALFSIQHLHLVPEAALIRGAAKGIYQRENALLIHEGENLPDAGDAEYIQVGRSKIRRTKDRYVVLLDANKLLGIRPIGRARAFPAWDISASRILKQPVHN
jgi:hypothetical protein